MDPTKPVPTALLSEVNLRVKKEPVVVMGYRLVEEPLYVPRKVSLVERPSYSNKWSQHDSVSTLSRVRTIVDALGLVRVTVQDMPLG